MIGAEQDILGLPFGVEYGSTGTGTLMLSMAVEGLARVDASYAPRKSQWPGCAVVLIGHK